MKPEQKIMLAAKSILASMAILSSTTNATEIASSATVANLPLTVNGALDAPIVTWTPDAPRSGASIGTSLGTIEMEAPGLSAALSAPRWTLTQCENTPTVDGKPLTITFKAIDGTGNLNNDLPSTVVVNQGKMTTQGLNYMNLESTSKFAKLSLHAASAVPGPGSYTGCLRVTYYADVL